MAQHHFEHRYKHRKVIPISPTSRKNTMMTNNTTPHSPHRSTPKADRKDRQQPQQCDTASVASTVKISNVATPSPVPKVIPVDDSRSIMKMARPSNIKSILDSRDDAHCRGNNINLYKRTEDYQHDSLVAPIARTAAIDDAPMASKEIFLLLTLEGLAPNDYLRIITDRAFIHPKLQLQLAGDRNQPFTNTRLRSFWHTLTIDDYNQISNSFFYHMRFTEKRTRSFHIQTIKRFFRICRIPLRRHSRATDEKIPTENDSTLPSSIPYTISRPSTASSDGNEGCMDASANTTTDSSGVPAPETVENETTHAPPASSSHLFSTQTAAEVSITAEDQNGIDILSIDPPPTTSSTPERKAAEQDPILILLDIADNASVNSSSTNGYATSMTSSIGSSSNMSRSYRHYNTFENRFHHRIPTANHSNPSNHHHTAPTNLTHGNAATSTPLNGNYQGTSTNNNVIDSYSQSKQHHRQQYDMDNDSTTSSNTGYISTMSNSHISISGSVASV